MTVRILNRVETLEIIRAQCATSRRVWMSVAFWGRDAAERININQINTKLPNSDVRFVCNLLSGPTDPSTVSKMLDLGFDVKHKLGLHSKVYVFDDLAIVGSSNASANGLCESGDETENWIETNVLINELQAIQDLASLDIFAGLDISPADIETAKRRHRLARARRPNSTVDDDVIDFSTLLLNRDAFRGRYRLILYHNNSSSDNFTNKLEARQAKIQTQHGIATYEGRYVDFFENWDELTKGVPLIVFLVGSRSGRLREPQFSWIRDTEKDCMLENDDGDSVPYVALRSAQDIPPVLSDRQITHDTDHWDKLTRMIYPMFRDEGELVDMDLADALDHYHTV